MSWFTFWQNNNFMKEDIISYSSLKNLYGKFNKFGMESHSVMLSVMKLAFYLQT